MKQKILVVEDDPHILLGLQELLKTEGFNLVVCERGDKAAALAAREQPDLIILDVMLPGLNGFEVCKQLRQQKTSSAILMLTAKSEEMDKVIGLELGADDYVTKPFGLRELLARIHALLRRTKIQDPTSFSVGAAIVDAKKFQVQRGKTFDDLTARELKLLQLFHAHPGEVLSRDRLLNEAWGYNYYGTTRTLDQTIVQLRRKIGDTGSEPKYLLTVHGVGYKLADSPGRKSARI